MKIVLQGSTAVAKTYIGMAKKFMRVAKKARISLGLHRLERVRMIGTTRIRTVSTPFGEKSWITAVAANLIPEFIWRMGGTYPGDFPHTSYYFDLDDGDALVATFTEDDHYSFVTSGTKIFALTYPTGEAISSVSDIGVLQIVTDEITGAYVDFVPSQAGWDFSENYITPEDYSTILSDVDNVDRAKPLDVEGKLTVFCSDETKVITISDTGDTGTIVQFDPAGGATPGMGRWDVVGTVPESYVRYAHAGGGLVVASIAYGGSPPRYACRTSSNLTTWATGALTYDVGTNSCDLIDGYSEGVFISIPSGNGYQMAKGADVSCSFKLDYTGTFTALTASGNTELSIKYSAEVGGVVYVYVDHWSGTTNSGIYKVSGASLVPVKLDIPATDIEWMISRGDYLVLGVDPASTLVATYGTIVQYDLTTDEFGPFFGIGGSETVRELFSSGLVTDLAFIKTAVTGTFETGDTQTLTAWVSGADGSDVSADTVWTSDMDGALGTGTSIDVLLSENTHVITATNGTQLSRENVTVSAPAEGPPSPPR